MLHGLNQLWHFVPCGLLRPMVMHVFLNTLCITTLSVVPSTRHKSYRPICEICCQNQNNSLSSKSEVFPVRARSVASQLGQNLSKLNSVCS